MMKELEEVKLFISYSRKDIKAAEKIEQKLHDNRFNVWRDVSDIDPGVNWSRESAKSLASRDIMVLLWSKNAATSRTVKHEWLTARALEKGIIPCFLEPLENLSEDLKLPHALEHINGISFSDFKTGIDMLITTLSNPNPESIDRTYDYTKLPPHAFIPFRPNPNFVGRHTELLELYLSLIGELSVVAINQVVSVFGLGGIGKTQLAVEFAYRFAFAFPEGVLWLNAARDWQAEFAGAARKLELTVDDPTSSDADTRLFHKLQGYISEHNSMLVVMDNVADPSKLDDEVLPGFVPTALGCDLMVTSRSQALPVNAKALEVKVLSADAAFELLTKGNPPASEEEVSAKRICATLGNLPLAVELAGAYLHEKRGTITYAVYLKNLEARRLQILEEKRKGIKPAVHEPSILATFESQYELLEDENAKYLFKLAGQFPEAAMIPVARLGLLAGIENLPETLDTPLDDAFKFLVRICLVEQLQNYQIRLHPLVCEFAESLIAKEKRVAVLNRAAINLHNAYNDILRLEREYIERGIDSVIDDIQVGIEWCTSGTRYREELIQLQRVLDRERHNLRIDGYVEIPPHHQDRLFLQQLHYRARIMGMDGLAESFCAALGTKNTPFFKIYGGEYFEDPAWIRTFKGHSGEVTAVCMSSDGRNALSGSGDWTLILWDVKSGNALRTFEGHSGEVTAVCMSSDGRNALSGSEDKTLILWDVKSGNALRTYKGHSDYAWAVSMSSDGRNALSGSSDMTLILWDVKSGNALRTFKGHSEWVRAVCMSSDGKYALSGSGDKTLILWDVKSGNALRTFEGHSGWVRAVSMSSDGRKALSGSEDETLTLWDVKSGNALRTFRGHSWEVTAVCMSSDGRNALSGSGDKTLILWDVKSGVILKRLYVKSRVSCLSLKGTSVAFGDWAGQLTFLELIPPRPSKSD
jgi:WD40 repeat protein